MYGDSTLVPSSVMSYAALSAMDGESAITEDSAVIWAATSVMGADSSTGLGGTVVYSAENSMAGASIFEATPSEFDTETLSFSADSDFEASANLLAALNISILGVAGMTFVPAGITITNYSRGPQIPATARPLTVPTIRIVPPAPPPPTYSVGSPPTNRRRRGL